jgi:transposase-like protein
MQRRLTDSEIEQVVQQYRHGDSIDRLSRRYGVHRTTVVGHLAREGIARRRVVRKLTDQSVAVAAAQYEAGASLAVVANAFGVHDRTLAREFRRAGVPIRPRRGWHP